jgi:hypothetical protein
MLMICDSGVTVVLALPESKGLVDEITIEQLLDQKVKCMFCPHWNMKTMLTIFFSR